jgi:release factor glutamine methyltransferase
VSKPGDVPATIDQAVRKLAAQLTKAQIEPPFTEARLIAELAGFDRMAMLSDPNKAISPEQWRVMFAALEKRMAGLPVSRQRGWVMFDGRRFKHVAETLEPRDDTLCVIHAVTPFVQAVPACRILDIGTGTGIIALTLLARTGGTTTALATDIVPEAVRAAIQNAEMLGLSDRFTCIVSDLIKDVTGAFDLIISNPPYIERAAIPLLDREVREHDPHIALDGGPDGLVFYRRIANEAKHLLAAGGRIAVEIGFDQRDSVAMIFRYAGYQELSFHRDLGGRPRALVFAVA